VGGQQVDRLVGAEHVQFMGDGVQIVGLVSPIPRSHPMPDRQIRSAFLTSCVVGRMQGEVTMIELTPDQVLALAQAGSSPTVIDPTTGKVGTLVPTAAGSATQETARPRETPAPPWQHLVVRNHPWRKQLYIKGRNMTVRHVVGAVRANCLTEEEAARDLHLPVEAIREALVYFEANPEVIALDHATEMYLISLEGGKGRGPESVPR
jgi:uncharacterized protein (DUF433 family)